MESISVVAQTKRENQSYLLTAHEKGRDFTRIRVYNENYIEKASKMLTKSLENVFKITVKISKKF